MKTKARGELPSVKEYLTAQIDICGRRQKDIATDIGYTKPNMITMLKQGLTKLPLDKVGLMANAIGCDPKYLLRVAINDYMPDTLPLIEDMIGLMVTEHEAEIILELRKTTKDNDPKMTRKESKALLKDFAKSL